MEDACTRSHDRISLQALWTRSLSELLNEKDLFSRVEKSRYKTIHTYAQEPKISVQKNAARDPKRHKISLVCIVQRVWGQRLAENKNLRVAQMAQEVCKLELVRFIEAQEHLRRRRWRWLRSRWRLENNCS